MTVTALECNAPFHQQVALNHTSSASTAIRTFPDCLLLFFFYSQSILIKCYFHSFRVVWRLWFACDCSPAPYLCNDRGAATVAYIVLCFVRCSKMIGNVKMYTLWSHFSIPDHHSNMAAPAEEDPLYTEDIKGSTFKTHCPFKKEHTAPLRKNTLPL